MSYATSFHNIFGNSQNQITRSSPYRSPGTIPFELKQWKGPELPVVPAFPAIIWNKRLRLAVLVSTPLGHVHQCRWARGCLFFRERQSLLYMYSALVAKQNRRGSLHLKWRCFVPDYYNLPIWRSEARHKEVYEVDGNGPSEATGADEKEIQCCVCLWCDWNTIIIRGVMALVSNQVKHTEPTEIHLNTMFKTFPAGVRDKLILRHIVILSWKMPQCTKSQ